MRGLKLLLVIVIPLSFAFGLAWGWKVRRDRAARSEQELATVKTVRILALDKILPRETIAEFEATHPIKVELTETSDPTVLIAKWMEAKTANREPDLVTLLYSQIPETSKALRLQPFDEKRLPHFVWISKDFVDWPRSRDWPTTAPLAWGFDHWSTRKPTAGKKVLWVATLAMTSNVVQMDEVMTFADWLLTKEAALSRSKASGYATTSLELEVSELPESAKASFLRKVPLTDYVIDEVDPPPAPVTERERE